MRAQTFFGFVLTTSMLAFGSLGCIVAEPESEESVEVMEQAQAEAPVSQSMPVQNVDLGISQAKDNSAQAFAQAKTPLDTPTLSASGATQTTITIKVCAGDTGAAAGFSLQWTTADSYAQFGWAEGVDENYCAASFSGNANGSAYSLGPNECIEVVVGALDPNEPGVSFNEGCNVGLACGTEYAFRTFAHAVPKTDFGASPKSDPPLFASTASCNDGCTLTQGFWKTHDGSPNADVWPISSIQLGSTVYSQAEASAIFDQSVSGNGLVSLAHQLMAAKLNIANGANPADANSAIAMADALIDGLVVPPVGGGFLSPATTSGLVASLTAYNEGITGPGHCE